MTTVPDVATPIRAWRAWTAANMRPNGDGTVTAPKVLLAAVWRVPWLRQPFEAACSTSRHDGLAPPRPGCHCGVYACATPETLLEVLGGICNADTGRPVVFGQVDLWGRVERHERGYRAQFARVATLYGLDGPVESLPSASVERVEPLVFQRWRYGICRCSRCRGWRPSRAKYDPLGAPGVWSRVVP